MWFDLFQLLLLEENELFYMMNISNNKKNSAS